MQPFCILTDEERERIYPVLDAVPGNPYEDYKSFSDGVRELIDGTNIEPLPEVFGKIRAERESGTSDVHVIRNCPIDSPLPFIGHADPLADKYKKKQTFTGEAFLELVAQLTGTPLLAYATRFNGDFFIDVIAHDAYRGKQTGFTDGELVYHNDRTAHPVRADYISLLGMRCAEDELIYTCFVPGASLLEHLSEDDRRLLRQPYFVTPFDVFSKAANPKLGTSGEHPILENDHSFRYLDSHTTVMPDSPVAARDALIALKNSLARAPKIRHRILRGDLLTFANQDGLHAREWVEVTDVQQARDRWLLKTYAFRDEAAASRFADRWVGGVRGRVGD